LSYRGQPGRLLGGRLGRRLLGFLGRFFAVRGLGFGFRRGLRLGRVRFRHGGGQQVQQAGAGGGLAGVFLARFLDLLAGGVDAFVDLFLRGVEGALGFLAQPAGGLVDLLGGGFGFFGEFGGLFGRGIGQIARLFGGVVIGRQTLFRDLDRFRGAAEGALGGFLLRFFLRVDPAFLPACPWRFS